MVSAYEAAGVRCHFLEPDPALPYQVFARDSSVATPQGAVVTQLHQQWRRGEYAAVIRFYQEAGIPIHRMITAGALEGGDVIIVEPGRMVIGNGEERTEAPAAQQLAAWMEELGWEVRIEMIPSQFVHIDVLLSILAPKLAAVCVGRGRRRPGPLAARVRVRDPRGTGCGGVCARRQRDLPGRRPGALQRVLEEPQRAAPRLAASRSSIPT